MFKSMVENLLMKIEETKLWHYIHTWTAKSCKGTIMNQLPSLLGGSLKITLTVPLNLISNHNLSQ